MTACSLRSGLCLVSTCYGEVETKDSVPSVLIGCNMGFQSALERYVSFREWDRAAELMFLGEEILS